MLSCMNACMCVFITFLNHKLYISFSYEDIFTKFAEDVYGCENMSVKNRSSHFKTTTWPPWQIARKSLMCSKIKNIAASCVRFAQNIND